MYISQQVHCIKWFLISAMLEKSYSKSISPFSQSGGLTSRCDVRVAKRNYSPHFLFYQQPSSTLYVTSHAQEEEKEKKNAAEIKVQNSNFLRLLAELKQKQKKIIIRTIRKYYNFNLAFLIQELKVRVGVCSSLYVVTKRPLLCMCELFLTLLFILPSPDSQKHRQAFGERTTESTFHHINQKLDVSLTYLNS